jgi:hypothetical protein
MNEQTMRDVLSHRPFQPFEIELSSGQRHSVRHPENAVLTRSRIVIVNPEIDSVAVTSLLHITSVNYLNVA